MSSKCRVIMIFVITLYLLYIMNIIELVMWLVNFYTFDYIKFK